MTGDVVSLPIPGCAPGVSSDPLTHAMAGALYWLGARLDDDAACALKLLQAGYPAKVIGQRLDAVLAIARAKSA